VSEPQTGLSAHVYVCFSCVSAVAVDVQAVDGCIYPRWSRPFRLCRLRISAVVHCADPGTCTCRYWGRSVCLSVCSIIRL